MRCFPNSRPLAHALILAAPLIGCASRPAVPSVASGEYRDVDLRVEPEGSEQVVVAQLPSPGWSLSLHRTSPALHCREVFVTLRRPDPAVPYPQVLVTQRLATGVPAREPVRVLARTLDFAQRAEGQSFRRAADAPARPLP